MRPHDVLSGSALSISPLKARVPKIVDHGRSAMSETLSGYLRWLSCFETGFLHAHQRAVGAPVGRSRQPIHCTLFGMHASDPYASGAGCFLTKDRKGDILRLALCSCRAPDRLIQDLFSSARLANTWCPSWQFSTHAMMKAQLGNAPLQPDCGVHPDRSEWCSAARALDAYRT